MKKLIKFSGILLFSFFFFLFSSSSTASAVSASEWDAGRIIDDAVFTDANALSVQQIQAFLDSKMRQCDNAGEGTKFGRSRATYYAHNPAPFTCLKQYHENTTTLANNIGLFQKDGNNNYLRAPNGEYIPTIPAGAKSAAQIIYDAGQTHGISPKVLLVMLQKEQSLVGDDWPIKRQYEIAMGYGCPDTAPCDAEYYGFYNQVKKAAWQLRRYMTYPQNYNYAVGNRFVLYNPDSNCGGTTVNIRTAATAALYNYTPYQPNQGALSNYPGTAHCGAYGNRNFWFKFHEWFGSTNSIKPLVNLDWKFEYLDGSNEGIHPMANTLGSQPEAITYNDKLYIFYHDSTNGNLVVSYADATGWHREVLDGEGGDNGRIDSSVGTNSSAVVHKDKLHLFYYDQTNKDLRHALYDGILDLWSFETLDGDLTSPGTYSNDVGSSSIAISHNSYIQLFYFDKTYGNLRHAWFSASQGWKFENLDGDYGSVAGFNSKSIGLSPTATSHINGLQLFYYDSDSGNLRHAWTTSQGWKFENLDGDSQSISKESANVGAYSSVTRLAHGGLQLFYYDSDSGNLRHAWTTSQGWKFENLDGDSQSISKESANVGAYPEAIVRDGTLYIFYRDSSRGAIKYAWSDSKGWHFAPLEGHINTTSGLLNDTGFWPTATVLNGALQLFYFDNTARALRHTWGVDL